ncbi:hypothetical protein SLE2022_107350 [Rubroshorea leprosula]
MTKAETSFQGRRGMASKSMLLLLFIPFLSHHVRRKVRVTLFNLLKSVHRRIKPLLPMSQSDDHQSHAAPPPFDPSKPSVPISYPIKTLQDLDSRAYFDSFHYPFNKSRVPLQRNKLSLQDRPRVLVCHDLQGGYRDDKLVQGGSNAGAYAIWHWYLIDVFVYFSHNLVTLPPPCWTNTAHGHGVKVLGTFITEWDEGRVICKQLLSTKESARKYAERLAELAVALGFDGWLMNIEVKLDVGQIPNLKEFVSHLTTTMHSSVRGSLVIWYDSVTINGDLEYQNQLNEKNKPFFDICDGIFVNYSWKEDYPKLSAKVAGDRKFDVYMGIDVFGRGTYGGGQWTTNVALDVIKKDDVSAAIFAPGWVYETNQPPDFETAQNHWWSLVEKSWGVVQKYPTALPFFSNFDQGRGFHISVDGTQVSSAPWNNISSQGLQPFLDYTDSPAPNSIQVSVDFKGLSYSGGGNISFNGTLQGNSHFTTKLFQGDLLIGDSPLYFTYAVKSNANSLVGLSLEFSSEVKERKKLLLASHGFDHILNKFSKVIVPNQPRETEWAPSQGWVIQESSILMNGYTLTEIHAVCYRPQPESSTFGSESQSNIQGPEEYLAVLGYIRISNSKENPNFPPSTSWTVDGQYIEWAGSQGSRTLSLKINWKLKDGSESLFPSFNIYVEKLTKQEVEDVGGKLKGTPEYLGIAHVEAFYISDLTIPSDTSSLKFIIQVSDANGGTQKLDESPFFQVDVEVLFCVASMKAKLCCSAIKEPKFMLVTFDIISYYISRQTLSPAPTLTLLTTLSNKSHVPLQWNKLSLQDKPRILVYHDMQGGYLDDKWIQGGDDASAYSIWHWHLIDIFVYFSHSLVTLPPPCWANTAHRHGVNDGEQFC